MGRGGLQANICYHFAAFGDSLKFDMQHDHVLKKLHYDPLALTTGSSGWVGVCRQNICYHVAAFVIPFNLICNMAMF